MSSRLLLLVGVLGCLWSVDAWGNKNCVWHGSAPFCMASCPSGKFKVEGTQSSCGPNKVFCCLTGEKFVCCPNGWEGTAVEAMAIAKTKFFNSLH